jgi:Uma2 family endonuclease
MRAEAQRRAQFYAEMTPSEKVEFIDGEVVMHSPARNVHLDATFNVGTLMGNYVRLHRLGVVKIEKCLCVFPRNDYEPDIVFFGSEKAAQLTPETMKFPIPDLVVEILSESTEARDRGVKFEDYAAHGVREYWLIDAERKVIEQFVLRGDDYHLQTKTGSGEIVSEVISGFKAPVAACFDEAANLAAMQGLMG